MASDLRNIFENDRATVMVAAPNPSLNPDASPERPVFRSLPMLLVNSNVRIS